MGLAKAELALDDLGIRLGDLGLVAEVALALGALLGEDMALECVRSFDLAVLGEVESFLGAAMGLQLRHSGSPSV